MTLVEILITFRNMQNVIIISTNVIIMLAFCPIQKGVMLPVYMIQTKMATESNS